ncbi:MFS transporter [Yinghuangia sp. ASG 101]|uniref:MFS transporter n=1 Tax=Yinghuangia sp. ASG 101 TaxID=2896848 RepID=UPI001E5FB8F8|nr:MFS transporter [Yinghuangia sp. ASG 101]UGQ08888.1 MFS transporter [Yinghuangia sp. ASG 101]
MALLRDLASLLRLRDFRRLFATRLTSQLSDGIFQVALAGHVFFAPEKQTSAGDVAAAFAILLLPYSLVGPFTGVLLDRWRRRQVLVWCNVLRAVLVAATAALVLLRVPNPVFFTACLLVLSVNRFVLAGLSAALPRVVPGERLVVANAVSPTAGTIAASAGALAAFVVHLFIAEGPTSTALVILISGAGYLGSAAVAATMAVDLLGPDADQITARVRDALLGVARGLRDGAAHVWERRAPAHALGAITVMRFCFGILTVMSLLLSRNLFHDPHNTDAGMATFGLIVGVTAVGFFAAAVLTPIVTPRIGVPGWIVVCALLGAVTQLSLGLTFALGPLLVAGFLLGLVSQGAKIGVDTIVQTTVDDAFRGRVFAVYDVLFNVAFVGAAAVSATALPADGRSAPVLCAVAAGFAATGLGYAAAVRRHPPRPLDGGTTGPAKSPQSGELGKSGNQGR